MGGIQPRGTRSNWVPSGSDSSMINGCLADLGDGAKLFHYRIDRLRDALSGVKTDPAPGGRMNLIGVLNPEPRNSNANRKTSPRGRRPLRARRD